MKMPFLRDSSASTARSPPRQEGGRGAPSAPLGWYWDRDAFPRTRVVAADPLSQAPQGTRPPPGIPSRGGGTAAREAHPRLRAGCQSRRRVGCQDVPWWTFRTIRGRFPSIRHTTPMTSTKPSIPREPGPSSSPQERPRDQGHRTRPDAGPKGQAPDALASLLRSTRTERVNSSLKRRFGEHLRSVHLWILRREFGLRVLAYTSPCSTGGAPSWP